MPPNERKHSMIRGLEDFEAPTTKRPMPFAQRNQSLHVRQERVRVLFLRFDVDALVVVFMVDDEWQIEALRVRPREASVPIGTPLHGGADAVSVAEIDVVTHADLVTVVDNRGSGQRTKQGVHKFYASPTVAQEWREPMPDPEVDARFRCSGEDSVHK